MNITKGKIAKAQKVILYGPEGIGKSTFAAQFPDPLFIDTEGSTNNMDVARLDKPSSWEFLHQQIEFVKQNRPCKSLIIDTIDWAEMLCIQSVCSQHNKKGIEDFGYGNGYVYTAEDFGRFLNKLNDVIDAGINVVLNAHSQIVKFEQPDEMGAYDRYQLKLGKRTSSQTAPLAKEWADMILFMNYKTFSVATDDKGKKHKAQGGKRTIYATHHPAWDAKNRHNLPDEFPMEYAQIAHIFNEQPAQAQQPEPVQQAEPQPSGNTGQLQQQPAPQPEQQQQAPVEQPKELDPSLPQALRDLMTQNGVSEEEIEVVVAQKGYFPMGTPIVNYGQDFIGGVLIAAWDQVFTMVQDFRKDLPFN